MKFRGTWSKLRINLLLLLFLASFNPGASAIKGGEDATGDLRVVAITGKTGQKGCSGALISPRVVYTAAHCLYRSKGINGSTFGVEIPNGTLPDSADLYVAAPGIEVRITGGKRVRVIAQFSDGRYQDSNTPIEGFPEIKYHYSLWDFGVLILEEELATKSVRIATLAEIEQAIQENLEATILGYGCKSFEDRANHQLGNADPRATKSTALIRNEILYKDSTLWMSPYPTRMLLNTRLPNGIYMGGGDSGSPLYINLRGELLYVGALSSSEGPNACTDPKSPIWNDPFWSVNASGTYYTAQAFPNVISQAEEYLKQFEINIGEKMRLEAEAKVKAEAAAKAAAELKAKQEAEAKAAATKKKSTITCVKGKTTKKVTAINPKCPKGYKKK